MPPGRKVALLVALAAALALACGVLLFLASRRPQAEPARAQAQAPAPGTFVLQQRRPPPGIQVDRRPRTNFAPPPGYQATPPAPPVPATDTRNAPVAAGELPLMPPLFDDPGARA